MLGLLFILCVFSINNRVNPIQIVFQFQEKFIRLRRRPRLRAETPAQDVLAKAGTSACRHGLCPWMNA